MHAKLPAILASLTVATIFTLVAGGAVYRVSAIKAKTASARAADQTTQRTLDAELHRQERLAAATDRAASAAHDKARQAAAADQARADAHSPAARELQRLENADRAALGLPPR